ncbi:hypothetical protein [Clostridium thermarum]|uniref:hypothetical protein n=1 Tax=Clostridium thermarum TaxID=1716543 RepID=UPI00111D4571|nr:hypothetical protein [Clostridium thermarum]
MANFKQIDMRFWQNDFVLGLTPEERYFYMYLVTNTMTTKCGIYKFNLKVAELETGYPAEVIERLLQSFESYGRIVVSKSTKEIMIVNWFKHNFKNSKRTIQEINKELKDVKNKEFLKHLYDICLGREYPVKEIFSGIRLKCDENAVLDKIEVDKSKADGVKDVEVVNTESLDAEKVLAAEEHLSTEVMVVEVPVVEAETLAEEVQVSEEAGGPAEEPKEIVTNARVDKPFMFWSLDKPDEDLEDGTIEEVVAEDLEYEEEDDDIIEGTTIAVWNFFEEGDDGERGTG